MELDAIADELYGLRPEEFTAARDARAAAARKAGDRALAERIGALRRPSLSAWAGNLLVRERPEETELLLRLGEGLRQAHRDLDGAQLRELGRRQRTLIGALSRQAGQLTARAGHPIGDDARREVENTLHTVLADPEAAREWATGRLVRPFEPATGFPTVAEGAVPRRAPAAPASKPSAPAARRDAEAAARRRGRLAGAREEARDAERELDAREREARTAHGEAEDAAQRAGRLLERARELTEELKRVEEERREAAADERRARERARTAERAVRGARRRAKTAAAQLERLAGEEEGA